MALDRAAAKAAGYTDAEIDAFLADQPEGAGPAAGKPLQVTIGGGGFDVEGAKAAGYTDREIADYLRSSAGDIPEEVTTIDVPPSQVEQLDYIPGVTVAPGDTDAAGIMGALARGSAAPMAGATLGAGLGSVIPGVGTAAGAAAGLGAGVLTEIVGDPIVSGVNSIFGTNFTKPTEALQNLLTSLGVPEADSEAERIVQKMATGVAGGVSGIGAGRALASMAGAGRPVLSRVGAAMAEQPAAQIAGGAGAGFASGMVPEDAGALAEIGAGLVGGIAGGAAGAGMAARRAATAAGGAMGGAGARTSVGAAGTPEAALRRQRAESFGVNILPPQETRDFADMQKMRELAKNAEVGGDLRDAMDQQTEQLSRAMERMVEGTGSEAWGSLNEQGVRITSGLAKMLDQSKTKVKTLYKQAKKSSDSENFVPLTQPVNANIDDEDVATTFFDYINSRPSGVQSSAVSDTARQFAVKMKIATTNENGDLVPNANGGATVRALEEFRREMVGVADPSQPSQLRDETIIKNLIDEHTEPYATGAWKKARAARREQAANFEDVGLVAQLLGTKRRSSDRQVAYEKVVEKIISRETPTASIEHVKKLLTGEGGEPQAWREVQGAVMEQIRDAAYAGISRNQRGETIISPAKINNTITQLDKGGKLEAIFDKPTAQMLRDIRMLVLDLETAPPGALNTSNTTSAAINALDWLARVPGVTGIAATGVSKAREAAVKQALKKEVRRLVGGNAQ